MRSLQMKLVLIFVLLIVSVMVIVAADAANVFPHKHHFIIYMRIRIIETCGKTAAVIYLKCMHTVIL